MGDEQSGNQKKAGMGSLFTSEVKVGLFVIASFVALFFMTFKIGGTSLFSTKGRNYFYVYFNTISGVSEKSQVKMAGVKVGEVRTIELDNRKVKITIDMDDHHNIPIDSVATVRSSGLLGEKFLNIEPGESTTYLPNGGVLEKSVDPSDIDEVVGKFSSILGDKDIGRLLSDLGEMTSGLKELITSNTEKFNRIIDNIDRSSEMLHLILKENREALRQGVVNIRNFSGNLNDILVENREALRQGVSNVRDFSGNLNDILVTNRENFNVTMANLKKSSEKLDKIMLDVQSITAKMEKGEGTIGKLIQDEEVYDNLNSTLAGAKGFVGQAENLKIGLGARVEREFDIKKTKSYFSIRVKPREDKYYLFEVSEDTRRTDLSARNTINSLLYSLMVAKRYGDVTLKAGLFESSGGVGLDYHAWRDNLMIGAELFNFSGYDSNASNPQLKITGKMYLQKYLYMYVGGDELLNNYYRTFFMGFGMMVDEDDFKFFLSLI